MGSQLVDIKTDEVLEGVKMCPLQFQYDLNHCRVLYRDDDGWKIEPGTHTHHLSDGPLENNAKLYEIHGHADRVPENCRKHTVDGREYAGELHFLHYDIVLDNLPGSLPGLVAHYKTIICVLLEEGSNVNTELSKITDKLPDLHMKNKKICLEDDIAPAHLFPKNRDFWMYEETNETAEGKVIWIIFKTPLEISQEQVVSLQTPFVRTKTGEAAASASAATASAATASASAATASASASAAAAATALPQMDRIILEGCAIPRISGCCDCSIF